MRGPTTRTILQNDDRNHLGLQCNALHEYQMAVITSGCVPFRRARVEAQTAEQVELQRQAEEKRIRDEAAAAETKMWKERMRSFNHSDSGWLNQEELLPMMAMLGCVHLVSKAEHVARIFTTFCTRKRLVRAPHNIDCPPIRWP